MASRPASSSLRSRPAASQPSRGEEEEEGEKGRGHAQAGEGRKPAVVPWDDPQGHGRIGWGLAIAALFVARRISAYSNLIHDCDEVFNYWEPLHFILYKSGFQTWEYSSEFALRSYLYLLVHSFILSPVSWWYGSGPGKVQVFYTLRLILGIASTICESALVVAVSSCYGRRLGAYTLLLLCFTSGCFNASTGFLPSTFSMYAVTLAAAALLFQKPCLAVFVSTIGVLIGWPFSILAFCPYVLYAFVSGGFKKIFLTGLITSLCTMVFSLLADLYFYGRQTSSVLNLIKYNVVGGGDSALYGVEGSFFYIHNGFNNFNIAFVLALLLPLVLLITRRRGFLLLLTLVLPIPMWIGFMSLQPHKEERFLFPIYPLICLAASAVVESFPDLIPKVLWNSDSSVLLKVAKVFRPLTLAAILALSYSRTSALLNGYSAPLQVYRYLPSLDDSNAGNGSVLCVGSEWHRFPSSFFLPSSGYRVRWIDDGFQGLLPFPFDLTAGGSAAAPPYFNKKNQASYEQFLHDEQACSFLIELDLRREGQVLRGSNTTAWEVIMEWPFLDNEMSPPLYRAFFIPISWQKLNAFGQYRLLGRKRWSRNAGAKMAGQES